MTVNTRQVAFKRKYLESYMFIKTVDSYSKHTLYIWWLVIQQSHEIFETTSPNRDQAPCIKRTSLLSFPKEKEKVNTKNRSNCWRRPLHWTCLHWEHHSYWLTSLLNLRSPLPLVRGWPFLLLKILVVNFRRRCSSKGATYSSFA